MLRAVKQSQPSLREQHLSCSNVPVLSLDSRRKSAARFHRMSLSTRRKLSNWPIYRPSSTKVYESIPLARRGFRACLPDSRSTVDMFQQGWVQFHHCHSGSDVVQETLTKRQTEIYTSAWTVTHDPGNFSDPMSFKPERWLDPESKDVKEASQPFSLGPRGCLGRK